MSSLSVTKQDLKDLFYLFIGSVLGVIATILVQIIASLPEFRIFSILLFLGVLFGIYKITNRLSKGSLVVKILKLLRSYYRMDDIK